MKKLLSSVLLLGCICLNGAATDEPATNTAVSDSAILRFNAFTSLYCPEKLYVHIDRTYFRAGETIWMCGYLRNASERSVQVESNFIYAELLDTKGNAVIRAKLKRSGDTFPGHLDLPEDIAGGKYTLRAYSLWQLNGPATAMFHQSIQIYDKAPRTQKTPSGNAAVDVTFYPEGGRHFAGTPSVIGVKAMNPDGSPATVSGDVVNEAGVQICEFSTFHDGMGTISFISTPGTAYFLRLSDGRRLRLPSPSEDGATVMVSSIHGRSIITVDGKPSNVPYRLMLRDISNLRTISTFKIPDTPLSFIIDRSKIREGINHALLVAPDGSIVSERPFYNYGVLSQGPECTLSRGNAATADSLATGMKTPVTMTLSSPDGKPLDGHCSIAIVHSLLKDFRQLDGIRSYMNLSSELAGAVHNPRYYFDDSIPERERSRSMDMLMMIQGWKYYDLAPLLKGEKLKINCESKEYSQHVTGRIRRRISGRMPKKFIIYVIIPRQKFTNFVEVQQSDSYIVDSLDFPENTGFLVKVSRLAEGLDYVPTWDGDKFAPAYAYAPNPGSGQVFSKRKDDLFVYSSPSTDTLQTAVVTASVDDFFGASGRQVSSSDMVMYADRTIVEYITMRYPSLHYTDEKMYNVHPVGGRLGDRENGDEEMGIESEETIDTSSGGAEVKLIADESEQEWAFFDSMTLDNLQFINVSTMPDAFYNSLGGLVTIKVKPGVQFEHNSTTEPSLVYFAPLGWQQPRDFYCPVYDSPEQEQEYNRRTIFWSPSVKFKGGRASFTFLMPNAFAGQECQARVEGVTADGTPFSYTATCR